MEIKVYCMNPDECKEKKVYSVKGRRIYKSVRKVQICMKKGPCPLAIPVSQPPIFYFC